MGRPRPFGSLEAAAAAGEVERRGTEEGEEEEEEHRIREAVAAGCVSGSPD